MIQKPATGVLAFFYVSTLLAGDLKDIEISGFKVLATTPSMMKLQFREEKPFIISKTKFASEKQAKSFCEENGLNLDVKGFDKALLLAMSGAANLNGEIEQAISFKLNDKNSGVAAWTGSNDQIIVMWNGRGTSTDTGKIDDFAKAARKLGNPKTATFAAICE